ncbi:furin-like protease kpc-1 [Watersipora subatra]|uniref:furin-like protease kpc-1 n=1 Tax=Watersipora subatra TaxID=2589382 RepID=UPI00355B2B6C
MRAVIMRCCHWFVMLCLLPFATASFYSNLWAVHIEGGESVARLVAAETGFSYVGEIMAGFYHFRHNKVQKRSTINSAYHSELSLHSKVLWGEQQRIKIRKKRDTLMFNDEKYRQQWYLQDRGKRNGITMGVASAWRQGYTGKGVVVTILDDGIERSHPDLIDNYDPDASYDINDQDSDPTPHYDFTNENRHGTRCAGEVAAVANNSACGVGVAYEASIGGIKMLDGDVTDSVEAMSLSLRRDHIDIYSASWGPDDDGKTVDGPATLARKAFRDGVLWGRNGKGSIFVWASGNGGSHHDNCNCDGYTNSIYTLSVSSATEKGDVPWYSESCSSTLVSTFSSGGNDERQITTTDLRRGCTSLHTGTSASAPLAAGIVALTLQANPSLTWRDVQYISVLGASSAGLDADDWIKNGAGREVSHHFGFGMMNAKKMVEIASNWTNIPEQHVCEVASPDKMVLIMPKETRTLRLTTAGCQGSNKEVRYLEHVQAKITLSSSWRGDLQIWLTSPSGTRSSLLTSRVNDNSRTGFNEWGFLTTHNWGETSQGEWILEIANGYRAGKRARLNNWSLVLYGTATNPIQAPPTAPVPLEKTETVEVDIHPFKLETFITTAPLQHQTASNEQPIINHIPELLSYPKGDDIDWLDEQTTLADVEAEEKTARQCPLEKYRMRDRCLDECPSGFYPAKEDRLSRVCLSCHESCAECSDTHNHSCTECYFQYELRNGRCLLTSLEVQTGASKINIKRRFPLPAITVKSIIYGGLAILSILLVVLISLIIYCKRNQYVNRQRGAMRTITVYKPANPPDHTAGSQHSSQQELMDCDGEISSQDSQYRSSDTSIECKYTSLQQYPIQPV